jgi:hypothetical protein
MKDGTPSINSGQVRSDQGGASEGGGGCRNVTGFWHVRTSTVHMSVQYVCQCIL